MHIGIISPCSSGPLADLLPDSDGIDLGCGVHFMATLVRALIERGHAVSVITLSSDVSDRVIFKGPNITYYVYPMRTRRKMRDLFKLEREGLRDGITRARPDVLHAHWTYEFALACFETELPTVVTSHDNAFQQLWFSRDLYRLGRLYIQLQVVRKARFLTAVSPYLADSLQWLAKSPIEVIPNPVAVITNTFSEAGRCSGPARIATVLNGWGRRKNPKSAIRAFSVLRRELPDSEMFMYGHDFENGGIAAEWATREQMADNIHFCGFLAPADLHRELGKMSVLLHPALEESFGMVIIEAMANGLPVIAGNESGAVRWVLDEGRAGFLTNVNNPVKIAETILGCITDHEARKRKQRYALGKVLNAFSPDSVATQYERVYKRALGT
jgi:L-malate glycosyltransferase